MRASGPLARAAAAAVALPVALSAQRIDPTRIINLHINAEAQNVSLSGSIPEGGRFRLTMPDRKVYAVSPVLVQGQTFMVTLLRGGGKPEDGDNQTWRVVETARATVGRPVPLRTLRQVTVVIEGIDAARAATASAAPVRLELASYRQVVRSLVLFDGECCVTCNGVGACGCKVTAPCGSCCVPPCRCDTQPAPPPGGGMALRPGRDILAAYASGRRCPPVPDNERIFTARAEQPAAMVLSSR
jgi:hypothetical protein